jgi:hypothetical protein
MKFFKKINKVSIIVLAIAFTLGLGGIIAVRAVVLPFTPDLGVASTFALLSDVFNNTSATTTINGDIGFTTFNGTAPGFGTHTNYTPAGTAGTAQATALVALNSQDCTFSFATGAIDLATDTTHVTAGYGSGTRDYYPGVYCIDGAVSVGTAGITLNGAGTYVFRSTGARNTVTLSSVTLTDGLASACDVFWTPNGATTLNHDSNFKGTVIPVSQDITVYAGVAWIGRALTFGHVVTIPGADSSITVPTCTKPHLTVTKEVVGGGPKIANQFPLFIDAVLTTTGAAVEVSAGSHTVTETIDSDYTQSFSASCPLGIISLSSGVDKTCTITNTYVPPTLKLVKAVTNDNGGIELNTAWTLTATGAGGFSDNGGQEYFMQ